MAIDKETGLTDKQKKFCEEYIVDLNGTQAAIRAGYSEHTAHAIGAENLIKPLVIEYLKVLKAKVSDKVEVTVEMIKNEFRKHATFDIRKIYDENGALKNVHDLDDDTAMAIAGIKSTEITSEGVVVGYQKEVKTTDKLKALENLGKHVGFFEKDNEQKTSNVIIYLPEKDPK